MQNIKILIIRLSSFGDVLLTTPLVRILNKKYPQASLDFLTRSSNIQIFKNNPNISKIIAYENNLHQKIKDEICNSNYNIIIDLQNNLRSRRLHQGIKAQKFYYHKNNIQKFLLVKFKINLIKNKISNVAEKYIASVEGLEPDNNSLEYYPDNLKIDENKTKKRIGICPGAKHYTKSWPIDYYIELSKYLISNGYEVIILGGKSDESFAKQILEKVPECIYGITENNLDELYNSMYNCDLIVCNDSGLMHFACTIPKKNIIAIFGPTVKEFGFLPYNNQNATVVENENLNCRPCTHIGREKCPKQHFKCMKDITSLQILKIIEEKINANDL